MTASNAISIALCLVFAGCFRSNETKNELIVAKHIAATENSSGVHLLLSRIGTETTNSELGQNVLIQLCSEDLRVTL